MKKVVLYGVRHIELRRDIEHFLDDGCEIAGYSDSWYTSDVLDGKRFFRPEELPGIDCDCIIPLSFQESVLEDMEEGLKARGVPPEKIVRPTMFLRKGSEKMHADLIADVETQYQGEEGLIFGLSYSLRGIVEEELRPAFYDCSWHGLDLYYNYRIFQYMRRRGLLSKVKAALLVFPYYYFNYDMSKAPHHYRNGTLFAVHGLDDWHNYRQVPGGSDYVANYRMFGKKISEFYRARKRGQRGWGVYRGGDGEGELGGLWFHDHPETVEENKKLYADFRRELAAEGIEAFVIVPPYYLEGISRTSMEAYERRKTEFYQMIEAEGARVFDFSAAFADRRELFTDLTHVNAAGAEAFTRLINETVLRG